MDTFISVIIAGMAVGYITELVASLGERIISPKIIKILLTLPLSYFACWALGLTGLILAVSGPASAFFALTSLHLLNRPVNIQSINRR
jgi:hypothetical protein